MQIQASTRRLHGSSMTQLERHDVPRSQTQVQASEVVEYHHHMLGNVDGCLGDSTAVGGRQLGLGISILHFSTFWRRMVFISGGWTTIKCPSPTRNLPLTFTKLPLKFRSVPTWFGSFPTKFRWWNPNLETAMVDLIPVLVDQAEIVWKLVVWNSASGRPGQFTGRPLTGLVDLDSLLVDLVRKILNCHSSLRSSVVQCSDLTWNFFEIMSINVI